jgi:hypothetical protein
MKGRSFTLIFTVVLIFSLLPIDLQSQCAMCKQAAESSLNGKGGSVARGLNSGILYLMAVPYLAMAFIFRKQIYQLWKKFSARFSKSSVEG